MNPGDIHHLAAAYALDAVDEAERRAFEAHYPTCEICRADVADHRATLARLAAATPEAPAPEVRDRVLDEIARTRQLSPVLPVTDLTARRRRRRTVGGLALAAAAAVLLFVAGAVVVDRGAAPGVGGELAAVLDASDARLVALTPEAGAVGSVRVVWSPTTGRAVVLGDDLLPAPSGRAYELWLIDDAGPQPMRLLDAADDGRVRRAFDLATEPAAWGVTIEPVAGSDAPTSDILFLTDV